MTFYRAVILPFSTPAARGVLDKCLGAVCWRFSPRGWTTFLTPHFMMNAPCDPRHLPLERERMAAGRAGYTDAAHHPHASWNNAGDVAWVTIPALPCTGRTTAVWLHGEYAMELVYRETGPCLHRLPGWGVAGY